MQSFLLQVFNILTSNPGILLYHSVVAFSIAAALPVSLYQWRSSGFPEGRRAVIALSLLLLTRLVLFAISGLASQGIALQIQPALDRLVALVGLILIIWLWAFPRPARGGDAAALLLILLTLVASGVGLLWWSNQGTGISFNGSLPDLFSEIFALVLLGIGLLVLIIRRPEGWGSGLAILLVLALGHSANLLFPLTGKDYQGALRLAEMIAFPILLALPQRVPGVAPYLTAALPGGEAPDSRLNGPSVKVLQALISQSTTDSPEEVLPGICRAVAEWMQAGLCLIASPGEGNERLVIEAGYDLAKDHSVDRRLLEGNLAGVIANALRRGRPLRLPSSSIASDLRALKAALDVDVASHLLAVPITEGENASAHGVILLYPRLSSVWTADDQANLALLTPSLARILHHADASSKLREEILQRNTGQQTIQVKNDQIQRENEDLLAQLESLRQQSIQEHSRAESLAALIASQESSQETIAGLEAEIKNLRQASAQSQDTYSTELQRLQSELNRAQDEAALLQAKLDVDSQALTSQALPNQAEAGTTQVQEKPPAGNGAQPVLVHEIPAAVPGEQAEVVASLAQELRQPMSSIVGYTDLLLSESAGILGALQRKFLERVNASIERMRGLIDDLVQTTSLEMGELELKPEAVDLNLVIDEAVAMTIAQIREKSIVLRVDLPDQMPSIIADRDALQQILIHLLQNASSITPVDGEIALSASDQASGKNGENEKDYLLLRVSDTGGGIPPEDLSRVFSRLYRADNPLIQGVGDTGVGLSIVKTLVEAHGGRVWVDTELGRGSSFSVLLPTAPGRPLVAARKGAPSSRETPSGDAQKGNPR